MANRMRDEQLQAMQGEDMLSGEALLKRLLEVGGEGVTDMLAEYGPPALDFIMRALTGGTERENLARGQADPTYSKLGQLRTANIGSQEGHAVASEGLMNRFGPWHAAEAGLLGEGLEYLAGTSGSEGELLKDTMLDLGANAAGIVRPVSRGASDWIVDKLVSNYGNPARTPPAPIGPSGPLGSPPRTPRR